MLLDFVLSANTAYFNRKVYPYFNPKVPAAKAACPGGWHLPTDEEWKTLEMYLGMSQSEADAENERGTNEGKKLKSTRGWYNGGNGVDVVGFSALPGGERLDYGDFHCLGTCGFWWSATASGSTNAWVRVLYYNSDKAFRGDDNREGSFSVRCVRDTDNSK